MRPGVHPRLGDLVPFLAAVEASTGAEALSERKRLDLATPGPGSFGIEVLHHGRLIGYARVIASMTAPETWTLEIAERPEHRRLVEQHVLDELDTLAEQRQPHSITWWLPDGSQAALAISRGFEHSRELLEMTRPLIGFVSASAPAGVRIRPFIGTDSECSELVRVNNAAFDGHPEQGAWGIDDFLRRRQSPWFDAADLLLGWIDQRLVGFCWLKTLRSGADGDAHVELYALAVDPSAGVRGLGRALTTSAFADAAARRGGGVASLFVDASNERALRLYQSLGFQTSRRRCALMRQEPRPRSCAAPATP